MECNSKQFNPGDAKTLVLGLISNIIDIKFAGKTESGDYKVFKLFIKDAMITNMAAL